MKVYYAALFFCIMSYAPILFPGFYKCIFFLILCCRLFGKDMQGRDCGDEASRWLTSYLGGEKTFRLVHFEPQMKGRTMEEEVPDGTPLYQVSIPAVCAAFYYHIT